MTKLNVMLMSLPAALPAAYLTFLLVMVFLGYGGGGTVLHQALAGSALAMAGLVAFLPVGILLFYQGPPSVKKPRVDMPVAATSLIESLSGQDDRTMGGEDLEAMDEVIASASSQELEADQEGFDLGGFDESSGELAEISESDELATGIEDDAFDGIVDEITETDEEIALSQDALELPEDSLEDDGIADFDDLFGDEKKA